MKQLRQFCLGTLMVLALSITALAGDISMPGVTNGTQESSGITVHIPCPGAAGEMQNGITGDMPTPGAAGEIPNNVAGDMPFGITGDIPFPGILLFFISLF